jgi:hypothetical protein
MAEATFSVASSAKLEIPQTVTSPVLGRQAAIDLADGSAHYLHHRFDLLGSGWTQVRHGLTARGTAGFSYDSGDPVKPDRDGKWLCARINQANALEAQRIWNLVEDGYQPIDWHVDFKSGYRWSEKLWYRDVQVAPRPGVDIKVPWELARMQHLPQLALACLSTEGCVSGSSFSTPYVSEFRNQILDFMASNPPELGVNWACSMDVGLRIVNWVVAYALFLNSGARFDAEFERLLARSVYEHGRFLANNLEWQKRFRGNHYLANLLGLIVVSAYLEQSSETDMWLAFAIAELFRETLLQFHPDGGNFEGSLSYHCLSSEIVTVAAAIILGLDRDRLKRLPRNPVILCGIQTFPGDVLMKAGVFPSSFCERLSRAIDFVADLSSADGRLPMVGDHDSGRALKLVPVYSRVPLREAVGRFANLEGYANDDDQYLLEENAVVSDLLKEANAIRGREASDPQSWTIRLLSMGRMLKNDECDAGGGHKPIHARGWDALIGLQHGAALKRVFQLPWTSNVARDLALIAYPDSGWYLFKSSVLRLLIRCGEVGQNGVGGHCHLDQLSIDLWVDGEYLIRDPGTYLYTAHPETRNRYRSAVAHFGPSLASVDTYYLGKGLFQLADELKGECLIFSERRFGGRVLQRKHHVYRAIELTDTALVITDWTSAKGYSWEEYRPPAFSPAYGWAESRLPNAMSEISMPPTFETPLCPR